ncbi:HAUS augmin-like complex subunit 2 isoform X2 [Pempheris klunzingeri]
MHQWDPSPFSVSPAACLLSRCVSRGALSQEEIDSTSSRLSPSFSPHLYEAEHQTRMQRQLDELLLQRELLKTEKESADVTHSFYLIRRFQVLQTFYGHLQDLLKDEHSLRQRLMRPLGRTNLPVQAHLQRFVMELVTMLMDFTEAVEERLVSVRCRSNTIEHLAQLGEAVPQLLSQVAQVQSLCGQLLSWKDGSSGDGSA